MEASTYNPKPWIRIALINFCIVALAGITLRYKINFPLPSVNQKYLLHGHSHFAFSGWVALALMALLVNYIQQQKVVTNYKKYNRIFLANCVTAYGMLVSFIVQGYGPYSILFSILSILVSYFFILQAWRDLNNISDGSYAPRWFRAALILWAVSSLGAFALAYLMANQIMVQDYYFAASYFFLHFQYNGWFLFVCFGLLLSYLYSKGLTSSGPVNKTLFAVMAVSVGPTFFLSILWLRLPHALHLIANISAVLQLVVLIYFIRLAYLIKGTILYRLTKTSRYLWILAAIAFVIKIILQMLSIIPVLSSYAFGFRPIVIGFLHLSFLGIISFFIIGFINQILNDTYRPISKRGVSVFVFGVLMQEIILMSQGLEAIEFEPLPYADILLFVSAIIIGTGLISITISTTRLKLSGKV
ncbi:hypothetical protein GZH53_14535 [Flavihumibacter sp. R14]|nr:hypothetical protein [Flavihumibacter soli]